MLSEASSQCFWLKDQVGGFKCHKINDPNINFFFANFASFILKSPKTWNLGYLRAGNKLIMSLFSVSPPKISDCGKRPLSLRVRQSMPYTALKAISSLLLSPPLTMSLDLADRAPELAHSHTCTLTGDRLKQARLPPMIGYDRHVDYSRPVRREKSSIQPPRRPRQAVGWRQQDGTDLDHSHHRTDYGTGVLKYVQLNLICMPYKQ